MSEKNFDFARKPIGATKEMIEGGLSLELDNPSNCYVSVEHPCESGRLGARKFFEKYGYMVIRGLWNPKEFKEYPPEERGQIKYFGKIDKFSYIPVETQVNGSLSRYNHPKFKYAHSQIRIKLEEILGEKLNNTYYYDRFYFAGQRLDRHVDRDSCEISLTFQVGTNSNKPWAICFESPNKEEIYVNLKDGDAILYKGCEIDHWREPLKSKYNNFEKVFRKIKGLDDDTYHHQVFFHYVLANGTRVHHSNDVI